MAQKPEVKAANDLTPAEMCDFAVRLRRHAQENSRLEPGLSQLAQQAAVRAEVLRAQELADKLMALDEDEAA